MVSTVSFLKQVAIFNGLSQKDLREIESIAKVRRVLQGQEIFSVSALGDSLYIVLAGSVKIYTTSSRGRRKTFDYLETRDFFGEMALLDEKEVRSASAVALKDSVLLTIHKRDFRRLLLTKPHLAFSVLQTVCKRLRKADQEIENLTFQDVLGRVARILLDLAQRYGQKMTQGTKIQLEMTRQELADLAGTAREIVTRILQRFRRMDCLLFEGKKIIITDAKKLKQWIS